MPKRDAGARGTGTVTRWHSAPTRKQTRVLRVCILVCHVGVSRESTPRARDYCVYSTGTVHSASSDSEVMFEAALAGEISYGQNSSSDFQSNMTSLAGVAAGALDPSWPIFYNDLHQKYIHELGEKTESYEYQVTEHLRMSGIYWGFTAMSLLGAKETMNPPDIVDWVLSTYQHDASTNTGGWGGNLGHDMHILYTTSAVQILAIAGNLNLLEQTEEEEGKGTKKDAIVRYIKSLQQVDGSFAGDQWLEIDTRFSYCAMLTLSILHRLDAVDVESSNEFIVSCQNFDGGYGCVPGAEVRLDLFFFVVFFFFVVQYFFPFSACFSCTTFLRPSSLTLLMLCSLLLLLPTSTFVYFNSRMLDKSFVALPLCQSVTVWTK